MNDISKCTVCYFVSDTLLKIHNFVDRVRFNFVSYRAIDTHATASVFPTDIHGHSLLGHFLVVFAGRCVAIAIALLAVKALTSRAGLPRDLIVHGAAFFASFAARVTLAFAFLMLRDNEKCAYRISRNVHILKLHLSIKPHGLLYCRHAAEGLPITLCIFA